MAERAVAGDMSEEAVVAYGQLREQMPALADALARPQHLRTDADKALIHAGQWELEAPTVEQLIDRVELGLASLGLNPGGPGPSLFAAADGRHWHELYSWDGTRMTRRALAGGVRRRQAATVSVGEADLVAAWAVQWQPLDSTEVGGVAAGDVEDPAGAALREPSDHAGLWGQVRPLEGEGEVAPLAVAAHRLSGSRGLRPVDNVVDRRSLSDHPIGQALQVGEEGHEEVPATVGLCWSIAAEEHLAAALAVEKLKDASTALAGDLGLAVDPPDRPACRAVLGRHLVAVWV